MDNESKSYLKFEYSNSSRYKTTMIKENVDGWASNEISMLVEEFRNFLMSCGFTEATVDDYVPTIL